MEKVVIQPYYRHGSCGDGCCSWTERRHDIIRCSDNKVIDDSDFDCYPNSYSVGEIIRIYEAGCAYATPFQIVEILQEIHEYVDESTDDLL